MAIKILTWNTLELYVLDPTARSKLEDILQLEPQERGYEVLLIEPYYKSLLNSPRFRQRHENLSRFF